GNIRQMRSVIRAAMAMKDEGELLERRHLPDDFLAGLAQEAAASHGISASPSAESLAQIELQAIRETIRRHNGNISAAARQLNVSRTTLYRRLNPASAATSEIKKAGRGAHHKQEKAVQG